MGEGLPLVGCSRSGHQNSQGHRHRAPQRRLPATAAQAPRPASSPSVVWIMCAIQLPWPASRRKAPASPANLNNVDTLVCRQRSLRRPSPLNSSFTAAVITTPGASPLALNTGPVRAHRQRRRARSALSLPRWACGRLIAADGAGHRRVPPVSVGPRVAVGDPSAAGGRLFVLAI